MIAIYKFPIAVTLRYSWKPVLSFTFWASAVYVGHFTYGLAWLTVPFLPISLVGTAVAFYVGFKNNSAYDRLWEARKIWGAITNISRFFGMKAIENLHHPLNGNVVGATALKKQLVHNHIAWVYALQYQLKKTSTFAFDERFGKHFYEKPIHEHYKAAPDLLNDSLAKFAGDAMRDRLQPFGNKANKVLQAQMALISQLLSEGYINEYQHSDFEKAIQECLAQQGAAERIKSFPFPRQYGYFASLFLSIFLLFLPLGLVGEFAQANNGSLAWLSIPASVLISWVFYSMELIGAYSENPFDHTINDVPIEHISRNIEIDLKELLEEEDIPAKTRPDASGVLF